MVFVERAEQVHDRMKEPPRAPGAFQIRASTRPAPAHLAQNVVAAVVMGLFQVLLGISLAALVFSGDLSPFIARGVGFALVGSIAAGVAVGLLSSLPGTFGGAQNGPAAILAVVAANLVAALGATASDEARFATVVLAVSLTTLTTGVFLLALGHFRLGNLVRFLPYPVVGGFLAGTSWLLVVGAIGVMSGATPGYFGRTELFAPHSLMLWLPGLVFAVVLLASVARSDHFLVVPGVIIGSIGLFFLVAFASGATMAELGAGGWLLGPFPAGDLWTPLTWGEIADVRWGAIAEQIPALAVVLPVAVVSVLLNAGGLEVTTRREVGLNRELRAAGVGNLLSAAAMGLVGYQQLGVTLLGRKLGVERRSVVLAAAAVAALTLFTGAALLSAIPRFVLGGLLLYIGLGFLKEWLYDAWFRLPPLEYAVVVTILVVIAAVGLLEGVAVGVLSAVVLFVVTYSRVDVARHEMAGEYVRSRVSRNPSLRNVLRDQAHRLHVLQLQGFVFFGTGETLLRRVRRRIEEPSAQDLRFLLLDFRRVTGLDSTAVLSFVKMEQVATLHGVTLVFTDVPASVRDRFEREGLAASAAVRFRTDLDDGVEWCEDRLLEEAEPPPTEADTLEEQLALLEPEDEDWRRFLPYLERRRLEPGESLMAQGDPPDRMYFLESGSLTARIERPHGPPLRLETMGGGSLVGELGFFLAQPRSASVVAEAESVVHCLEREAFHRMKEEDPQAALALHHLVVRLLSGRVGHLVGVVQALER